MYCTQLQVNAPCTLTCIRIAYRTITDPLLTLHRHLSHQPEQKKTLMGEFTYQQRPIMNDAKFMIIISFPSSQLTWFFFVTNNMLDIGGYGVYVQENHHKKKQKKKV